MNKKNVMIHELEVAWVSNKVFSNLAKIDKFVRVAITGDIDNVDSYMSGT